MAKNLKPDVTFDHPILEYAENYGWGVTQIERFELDNLVVRRFVLRKKYLPSIKLMLRDDKIVGATQHYFGQRLNPNRTPAKPGTIKRWLRSEER